MKRIIYVLTLLPCLLLLQTCTQDMIGPDGEVVKGGSLNKIDPLVLNKNEVDFSNGEFLTFSFKVNKDAVWEVKFIPADTRIPASYSFQGSSSMVGQDEFKWNGWTNKLPWFPQGECLAILNFVDFPELNDTLDFEITGLYNYDRYGVLITDFSDDFSHRRFDPIDSGSPWTSEFPAELRTASAANGFFPPDGTKYFRTNIASVTPWQGVPWGPDVFNTDGPHSPFIDIHNFPVSSILSIPDFSDSLLPINRGAENVYFNVMIFNEQELVPPAFRNYHEKYVFEVEESNGSVRRLEVIPDDDPTWAGWRLISVRYSDLETRTDPPTLFAPHDPKSVTQVNVILLSDAPMDQRESIGPRGVIDHISFTRDRPLGL